MSSLESEKGLAFLIPKEDKSKSIIELEKVVVEAKEKVLQELITNLNLLYPNQHTENPFYRLNVANYGKRWQAYHKLLVHFFTLIYKTHRMKEKGRYITEREDVLASLHLLEIINFKPERRLKNTTSESLKLLKAVFADEEIFCRKEAQIRLRLSKTTTSEMLRILHENKRICRVGGFKNRGYLYQINPFINDKE